MTLRAGDCATAAAGADKGATVGAFTGAADAGAAAAESATVRSQMLVRRSGMGSSADLAAALWKAGISSTGSGSTTRLRRLEKAAKRLRRGAGASGAGSGAPGRAPENKRRARPGGG